jgi:methionyl-tRNA synthetase
MTDDDQLAMNCQKCGFVGRALSSCEVCGEFLSPTLELRDDDEADDIPHADQ